MNVQDKILVGVAIALIMVAMVITFLPPPQPEEDNLEEVEALIRKAGEFGKGATDYYYSYEEDNDGYRIVYTLHAKGGEKMIEITNPLSVKKLYLLKNDTILCADFMRVSKCSSVLNNTDPLLHNYLLSLQRKFFDDENIEKEVEQMDYFLTYGFVILSPDIIAKTLNGRKCIEISYLIDYTNMTVDEANRFGISPSSPKQFDWRMCINNETGEVYSKYFNYSYLGREHEWGYKLLELEWNTNRQIVPPENITEGTYDVLLEESRWKNELQDCYSGSEEDKDRCIATIALQLKMKSICYLAGERRDRCLVSIVPLTLDETICTAVTDPGYRDDCYIEMAGGTKNNSYCSWITDPSKAEFCMNVSQPVNETAAIPNPAAVNCADKGYDYELREDNETGGVYGVCIYGGLECEEWALYRQECCLAGVDCASGNCTAQACVLAESEGNETDNTVDIEEFLQYIDEFGEENETTNETESP